MNARARSWTLCGFLFVATTLNYLDRQTVSILAPSIQREMQLDNEALGWLFAGFYYAYTLAQFVIGAALDRGNVRLIYGLAVGAWSLVAGLTGLARTFAMLFLFRVLLGLTEAANWPGAMRMVALHFPQNQRTLANGVFTSGTSVAAVIAPSLILGIAAVSGWRPAFGIVGSLGLLWLAGWIVFSRKLPVSSCDARPSRNSGYASALSNRRFWPVFVITICVNPALYFFLNWLPTYLAQRLGIASSSRMAGMLTIAYLALDLGNVGAGAIIYAALGLGVTMPNARRLVVCTGSLLSVSALFIPAAHNPQAAIALISCVTFALGLWVSMYLTFAQDVDSANVSTIAGLLGGSGALAGAFAMWGVGRVSARTGSFAIPLAGITAVLLVALIAAWVVTNQEPEIKARPAVSR
jgi:ACS family hexuronate transporter-like MFS transporter